LTVRLTAADHALANVNALLDARDTTAAADLWRSMAGRSDPLAGVYFSRRFAEAAAQAPDTISKLHLAQLAGEAAARATQSAEQRQNAFYNLAMLQAAAGDNAAVEASLRGAIAASPTWYKPHWALARLLSLAGRHEEARREALLALDLNGRRDAEVVATLGEILGSPANAK
jgi:hypothetical protein